MPALTSPTVVVATHGHCFDGMASAAAFTRLFSRLHPGVASRFVYRACDYGPGESAVPLAWLIGEENAILDFRYTAAPTLTWYFDHHATAFRTPEDRAHFDAGNPPRRYYEPAYPSCTKLIADVGRAQFGIDLDEPGDSSVPPGGGGGAQGLGALVSWADMIDSARFASAEAALARSEPELQLMTVVEHHGDDTFLADVIPRLLERSPAEVAHDDDIQARFRPLAEKRARVLERMRSRSVPRGSVAFCDLSDEPTEVAEKFAMYALFPEASYSVVLSKTPGRARISIGYNPWVGAPRTHNIGEICRRHGGGGHPVVGAITLGGAEAATAPALCESIIAELGAG
jgi:hypothetical protein